MDVAFELGVLNHCMNFTLVSNFNSNFLYHHKIQGISKLALHFVDIKIMKSRGRYIFWRDFIKLNILKGSFGTYQNKINSVL